MTMQEKKGGNINQECVQFLIFIYLSFILLDSNKYIWMDLNQVYNFIWIR